MSQNQTQSISQQTSRDQQSNNKIEGCIWANQNQTLNVEIQRCPEHENTELSLYDVDLKERKCPKCVIYCKDRSQYLNCRFIEIDSNDKIQAILNLEVSKAKQIYSIATSHLKKAENYKEIIKQRVLEKLKKQYDEIIRQLAKYLEKQRKAVQKNIQQAWNRTMKTSFPKFEQMEICIKSFSDNSKMILERISETYFLRDQCSLFNKELEENTSNLKKRIEKIEKDLSWNAIVHYSTIEQQYRKVEAISGTKKIFVTETEDQLLIDLNSPKKNLAQLVVELNCQIQRFNVEPKTERTCLSNDTLQSDQISLKSSQTISTTVSKLGSTKSKSSLVIKSMNQINKIDTQIREVCAKDIGISNTDAKKILQMTNKGFVKILDLSGNKISSAFIKDLSKNNIGKYLKIIKLQKNSIDVKDAAVLKKIQLLKGQGVSITI